jgi:hypothetical protein
MPPKPCEQFSSFMAISEDPTIPPTAWSMRASKHHLQWLRAKEVQREITVGEARVSDKASTMSEKIDWREE